MLKKRRFWIVTGTFLAIGLAFILFLFLTNHRFLSLGNTDTVAVKASEVTETVEEEIAPSEETENHGIVPDEIRQKILSGQTEGLKVVFLTFDDGPSSRTPQLLDLLDQYEVSATFFPNGTAEDSDELFREIEARGHTLGNHTKSHNYSLYGSPTALLSDIKDLRDEQTKSLGHEPDNHVFRFPGGSLTAESVDVQAVQDAGYNYVDWNVSSGDAAPNGLSAEETRQNILNGVHSHDVSVVLCHAEQKDSTMEALPEVLAQLKAEGYSFYRLDDGLPLARQV